MELLFLIGGFVLGILSVICLACIVSTTGEFRINTVDHEADYMSMHLDNQDHLFKKKYILLKIVRSEDASK